MEVYIEQKNNRYFLILDAKAATILELAIALAYINSLAGLLQGKKIDNLEEMRVLLDIIKGRERCKS